jgi:protein SCO1
MHRSPRSKATIAVLALSAALAPGGAASHGTHDHGNETPMVGTATEHLVVPDLPVADRRGKLEGLVSRLSGRGPVILSFIYTSCDSLCPMANAILQAAREIARSEPGPPVTFVSLTIDPANDTPEVLDATASLYSVGEDWLWLTAGTQGTAPLLASLGTRVVSLESHDPVFLVGDFCSFEFLRVVGLPDPTLLVAEARRLDGCA